MPLPNINVHITYMNKITLVMLSFLSRGNCRYVNFIVYGILLVSQITSNATYCVEIAVSGICTGDSGIINSTSCDFPHGMYKCSHSAAVMIWATHNLSSTDVECQWKKPSAPSEKVEAVEELFPAREYKLLTRAVKADVKPA